METLRVSACSSSIVCHAHPITLEMRKRKPRQTRTNQSRILTSRCRVVRILLIETGTFFCLMCNELLAVLEVRERCFQLRFESATTHAPCFPAHVPIIPRMYFRPTCTTDPSDLLYTFRRRLLSALGRVCWNRVSDLSPWPLRRSTGCPNAYVEALSLPLNLRTLDSRTRVPRSLMAASPPQM